MNKINNLTGIGAELRRDYPAEITALLRSEMTPKHLREQLLDYHQNDIAEVLETLEKEARVKLYAALDPATLAGILEYTADPGLYLEELPPQRKPSVLSNMDPALSMEYLDALEEEARQQLLARMDHEVRDDIILLSTFDEEEIGSRMTTNYIAIEADSSIKAAMRRLVGEAADNDNIATLYVIDHEGLFLGAIDLKDLIIARKEQALDDITMTSYPYFYATDRIEDCIERIKSYSEDSIPVLDGNNRLVGVLLSQDVAELIDDEIGEDYAKLAGLSAEEELHEPLWRSIGKRLPWLIVLLGLGLGVSGVVGAFEAVVAELSLIVCFQSLILGMAGNAGTQSLAVTIRVLMDERLTGKQRIFLIGKEARVGLVNGIILGILSIGFVGGYILLFKGYGIHEALAVALCTGGAMVISILLAGLSGTVTPLLFKHFGIDPAVASGPLITTVNDLVAVCSYYGLAWLFLIKLGGM